MAREVALDLLETIVRDPHLRPVAEHEAAPRPPADEEARRVTRPGAEPHDRDQQRDRDLSLAGDGAAEDHRGLARKDQADEGPRLEEREHANQCIGPVAQPARDVLEQLLLEREHPLRAAVEPPPRLRRLDAPPGPVEQLPAESLLERTDLEADRGLRHAELLRGL